MENWVRCKCNRLTSNSAIQVTSESESIRARAKVDLPFSEYTWTRAVPSRMVDLNLELAEWEVKLVDDNDVITAEVLLLLVSGAAGAGRVASFDWSLDVLFTDCCTSLWRREWCRWWQVKQDLLLHWLIPWPFPRQLKHKWLVLTKLRRSGTVFFLKSWQL